MTVKDKVRHAEEKVVLAKKGSDPLKLRMAIQSLAAWRTTTEEEYQGESS